MSSKTLKPGEKAPRSGQYEIIGSRGGRTGMERTVTRGEPLPPPLQSHQIILYPTLTEPSPGRYTQVGSLPDSLTP